MVGRDVVDTRMSQRAFATTQFGLETGQRPSGETTVEISDDTNGVGQRGATIERAASLVVDEKEVDPLRIDGRRERRDQRAQQFTLA